MSFLSRDNHPWNMCCMYRSAQLSNPIHCRFYPSQPHYDVSKFSPNRSTLVKTFSSIHASTLRSTSSLALSLMRRWVASRSSTINLLSALLVSFRCLINCLAGGSQVSKYPADGRSDLADVPEETEAPLTLPPAVDFPAFGDLDRAFPLGMMTVRSARFRVKIPSQWSANALVLSRKE